MSDPKIDDAVAKPAKPKKRFRILLGVSLALNLLVVGAVVGAMVKGPSSSGRGGPPGTREVSAPYVGAFDHATKRALRDEMRARLPDRRDAQAANRADYEAFVGVLRADTFDKEAAAGIIDTQFQRSGQFQRVGRALSIEKIDQMSLSERMAYADRLQKRLDDPKKRKRKKDR
ncbi:periplasmic heavy metal sensor [Planktotalea sp.]|uniref:periplasmic heavy metal sensor n=1 Tax=Planktotalea sp. TaxID=2029877 RepID=UPI0025FF79AD|nr:periplasmic heavy metal sensor [Planktotalea sp.]